MKTLLITILLVVQMNDKYTETMKKNIETLYATNSKEDLQQTINVFERVGNSEKTKWEPYYYASFGYLKISMAETESAKKDAYLDLALQALKNAITIRPNESEVVALEGFIHMMRITVDPASRGQHYSGLAFESFNKAVKINSENPRALMLLAQMQYGTAQFFGSPVTEACSTLDKALEKFSTSVSNDPIAPSWGKGQAEELKTRCN